MSPRWEPDFAGTHATTPVYDRGEYRVTVGRPSGIAYTKDNGDEVAGVRYSLKMVGAKNADGSIDDTMAGEEVSQLRLYVHSAGAMRMTKRILMALFGYDRNDEASFNDDVIGNGDFSIIPGETDDDRPTLGDGWTSCVGNEVDVILDQDEYEGELQQTHKSFSPVS